MSSLDDLQTQVDNLQRKVNMLAGCAAASNSVTKILLQKSSLGTDKTLIEDIRKVYAKSTVDAFVENLSGNQNTVEFEEGFRLALQTLFEKELTPP